MLSLCVYCETQRMLWALSLHTHQVVIVRFWVPLITAVSFPQLWKCMWKYMLLVSPSLVMVISSACELAAHPALVWKSEECRAFFFHTQMLFSFQWPCLFVCTPAHFSEVIYQSSVVQFLFGWCIYGTLSFIWCCLSAKYQIVSSIHASFFLQENS